MSKPRAQSAHPARAEKLLSDKENSRPISASRVLHDKEKYSQIKADRSAHFFNNTRVQTCAYIVRKNGTARAIQFPLEKTGWKAPNSYQNVKRSSEVTSWSR